MRQGDIRSSLVAAIYIKVKEPVFESPNNTKLGHNTISPEGETIRTFVGNFIARGAGQLPAQNPETAKALEAKIKDSERDRKELSGIQKLARENARKAKFTTKISGTAGCITTQALPRRGKPPSSLRKASPPPALSRRRATQKPRPFSPCGASR